MPRAKKTPAPVTFPPSVPMQPTPGHVYVVKAVLRDGYLSGRKYQPITWPRQTDASHTIESPDWTKRKECGGGLHAWIIDPSMDMGSCPEDIDACDCLVVEVEDNPSNLVRLDGKIKFRKGRVVAWFATWLEAHDFARPSTAIGGTRGTATAGDGGTATAGTRGTATAGDGGTATAGYGGTATAGDGGTATAGTRGTATAGDGGTATAGDRGTATAGDGGILSLEYYDAEKGRYRKKCAEVDEAGPIKPGVKYRLDGTEFVEVPAE